MSSTEVLRLQFANGLFVPDFVSDIGAPVAVAELEPRTGLDRITCPHCRRLHLVAGRFAIPTDTTRVVLCQGRLRTVNLITAV